MCAWRTPAKSAAEISAGDSVFAAPRLVRMVRWASGVTSARQRALATEPRLKRLTSTPALRKRST